MGHNTSKSRRLDARYMSDFTRYEMRNNTRMHPNIQSSHRRSQANKPGPVHRHSDVDWMKIPSSQLGYKHLAYAAARPAKKLEKTETLPSLYQNSPQLMHRGYNNAGTSSLQRRKLHSSPVRHQGYDYNTYDVSKSSAMHPEQQEDSPFRRLYTNVLADKENVNFASGGRFAATLPSSYAAGSATKNQLAFEDEKRRKHWNQHEKHQPGIPTGPSGMGPRVLPVPPPDRITSYQSAYYNGQQHELKRTTASYGELSGFYPADTDEIQLAGSEKSASKNSLAFRSHDMLLDDFGRFNASASNNNLSQLEEHPDKRPFKSQFSTESLQRRSSAEQQEYQKDRTSYFSRGQNTASRSTRNNSSAREDAISIIQSTSEDSDVNDYSWKRHADTKRERNFESRNENFYSSASKTTIDRRRHRVQNVPKSARSPDVSRAFSQSVKFRSSGPSGTVWENKPNDETKDEFPPLYSQRRDHPRTGTLQRKSRRQIENSYAPNDFSSDEASSTEAQTKNFENSGGVFDHPPLLAQEAFERQERRSKSKMTKSATDFGDISWKQGALPNKMEDLIKTMSKEQESKSLKQQKKKRRQKSNVSQESSSAMSAQDLEKVIENQLAAALTSIMKQKK